MNSKLAATIRAKKLGVLLRNARQSAGRSKKECGQGIGVSSSTINSFENGLFIGIEIKIFILFKLKYFILLIL